ncbi:MAG TPA: GGDEF domain-containing protein [Micromonosporaceae bacterium]|nr:GGDEF domain-containing protein [Micromonosporaceae bacterium]
MNHARLDQPHPREAAARVGGLMLVAGGVLSAIVLVGDVDQTSRRDGLAAAVDIVAIVLGALCVALPQRVPRVFLALLPMLGTALICGGMLLSRSVSDGGELLLIWPVLFAGYFLPWLWCWLSTAATVTAYIVVAVTVAGAAAISPAVNVTGTSVVTLLIVSSLRARLARVLAASQAEARTDGLTGLLNRRAFDEISVREVVRCRREGAPLALLLVDVDHFKRLNDTHGHPAGDTALRRIGDLLRVQARESDVLARFGGEEFALLLPACPPADAVRRAHQLRGLVEQASTGWISPLTVSIGVAVLPVHAEDLDALVGAADSALYIAKSVGRNAVEVAGPIAARGDRVMHDHRRGAVDAAR